MASTKGEGFVRFVGDAAAIYDHIDRLNSVAGLWEQLSYIADNPLVDNETVFDFPTEDDLLKIVYGPPFTIVFKNLLSGNLIIYSILNPAF